MVEPAPGKEFSRSGSVSGSEELWDGIVGVRGRLRLGSSNFFVPYYVDVGAGSSNLTWQGMIGLAYAFKWMDVVGAYRHLYYEKDDEYLIQDMQFSGPALGLRFRF